MRLYYTALKVIKLFFLLAVPMFALLTDTDAIAALLHRGNVNHSIKQVFTVVRVLKVGCFCLFLKWMCTCLDCFTGQ